MTLGILKRFCFGMSRSGRFNLSWSQGCPLSGIETLVARSDNINLLSILFSSNNRGCSMILRVRIKKTMQIINALLQRIDNIINPPRHPPGIVHPPCNPPDVVDVTRNPPGVRQRVHRFARAPRLRRIPRSAPAPGNNGEDCR